MAKKASTAETNINPYASPNVQPLRSYWSRFFPALRDAIRFYHQENRRQGITRWQQLASWLLLILLLLLFALPVMLLLFYLPQLFLSRLEP